MTLSRRQKTLLAKTYDQWLDVAPEPWGTWCPELSLAPEEIAAKAHVLCPGDEAYLSARVSQVISARRWILEHPGREHLAMLLQEYVGRCMCGLPFEPGVVAQVVLSFEQDSGALSWQTFGQSREQAEYISVDHRSYELFRDGIIAYTPMYKNGYVTLQKAIPSQESLFWQTPTWGFADRTQKRPWFLNLHGQLTRVASKLQWQPERGREDLVQELWLRWDEAMWGPNPYTPLRELLDLCPLPVPKPTHIRGLDVAEVIGRQEDQRTAWEMMRIDGRRGIASVLVFQHIRAVWLVIRSSYLLEPWPEEDSDPQAFRMHVVARDAGSELRGGAYRAQRRTHNFLSMNAMYQRLDLDEIRGEDALRDAIMQYPFAEFYGGLDRSMLEEKNERVLVWIRCGIGEDPPTAFFDALATNSQLL